ncbi:MAG: hypothetical protein COA78_34645 [Blastopirellula sp.]|nr:MAG: hypothetical protein COA78_34645 [Blastopirellula sp.]
MERDPAHRYESSELMANALKRFLDGREVLDRPTRYDVELQGKIQNYLTEIQGWQEQKLITVSEMDRLLRAPSWFRIRFETRWQPRSREYDWETIGIRFGAWLVLLSSLLWMIVYWDHLNTFQRLLSIGFPTVAMNSLGWIFYLRKSLWNMRIFLGTGALLLPLMVVVVLDEYNLLEFNQGDEWELLSTFSPKDYITPTNLQLTVGVTAFVVYCILLVRVSQG